MNTDTDYAALYHADVSQDREMLEKNVRDYPASSVARFLLLYYLKKNNDPRFNEVALQTGIYLHDPYWIDLQLSKIKAETEEDFFDIPVESPQVENTEFNEVSEEATQASPESTFLNQGEENENTRPVAADDETGQEENLPLPVNEEITENFNLETASSETVNETDPEATEQVLQPQADLGEEEPGDGNYSLQATGETNDNLNSEATTSINENEEVTSIERNEENSEEVPYIEEPSEDLANEESQSVQRVVDLTQPQEEGSQAEAEGNSDFNKDDSVFDIKIPTEEDANQIESTSDTGNNHEEDGDLSIPFEPLHAVDYFASQGIHLTEDAISDDQLGKQVKSFTAWLKSMKKLHPGQLPEQNEVIEKLIQTSSEASNQSANVLTEAMAEVLVKQGKRDKAIEMYQKLSLINPSKSAYFAAKIESLKII